MKNGNRGGLNPYNVNMVIYIGHGAILPNEDAVAMIPFKDKDDNTTIKLINLEDYARRFAQTADHINVFLFSACRSYLFQYGDP